jgi:hypothetical protein
MKWIQSPSQRIAARRNGGFIVGQQHLIAELDDEFFEFCCEETQAFRRAYGPLQTYPGGGSSGPELAVFCGL